MLEKADMDLGYLTQCVMDIQDFRLVWFVSKLVSTITAANGLGLPNKNHSRKPCGLQ